MTDDEIKELLNRVQNDEAIPSDILESVLLEFMKARGIIDDNSDIRKAYKAFFNKIRLAETQYTKARNRLEKIQHAVTIIDRAREELHEGLGEV